MFSAQFADERKGSKDAILHGINTLRETIVRGSAHSGAGLILELSKEEAAVKR